MPNRILRDWTDSDRVDKLTAEGEVFFTRLIMKADDYGRFHAETKRLKAACFPLKESIRNTDIARWLQECEAAGLVRCYDAPEGRFLCIERFDQRLRIKREKFPRPPDGHVSDIRPSHDGHLTVTRQIPSDSNSDSDSTSRSVSSEGEFEGKPADERPELRNRLNRMFLRSANSRWSYLEESQSVTVMQRPDWLSELAEIEAYKLKNAPYFPMSLERLLEGWSRTLDNARNFKPAGARSTPLYPGSAPVNGF